MISPYENRENGNKASTYAKRVKVPLNGYSVAHRHIVGFR